MDGKKRNCADIQTLKPTIWIGKQGISPSLYDEIRLQLKVRKVIKIKWLRSVEIDPDAVASACRAHLVDVRGRTMVLSRE